MMISLEDIQTAKERLDGSVRKTPILDMEIVKDRLSATGRLSLKLECLQVTGSFKARGATNKVRALDPAVARRGLVAASGGNHGLGVAYAGLKAGAPVVIYLPGNTPPPKVEKLRAWGATVVIHGEVWDDANRKALEIAAERGLTYVHPFADPYVMAGQGTIGLEILDDDADVDTVIVAIGGGGLIGGVATALKTLKPGVRVIGVEPEGAATLERSLAAGEAVTLPAIETGATSLAPRASTEENLEIIRKYVDDILLVSDDDMRRAAGWLWREAGLAAELSAAATVAILQRGGYVPRSGERVCCLVCGAGTDGIS